MGTRSKEYPQSMFYSKIRKMHIPVNPFYDIHVGYKGYILHGHVSMVKCKRAFQISSEIFGHEREPNTV